MEIRCSNSAAVLAVLMGGGVCVFFATAACAGDRIDFSAPAVPLGVPQPEVEVKQPARMIGSAGISDGLMDDVGQAGPSQYYIVKPKKRDRDNDVWGLAPLPGDSSSQRDGDDLFALQSDSTRVTSSNRPNMKPGSNPSGPGNLLQQRNGLGLDGAQNDSRFGGQDGMDADSSRLGTQIGLDRDTSRFGAQNEPDRDNSRFGTQNGSDKDSSRFGTQNGSDRDNTQFGTTNGSDRDYAKSAAQKGLEKDPARGADWLGRGLSGADADSPWTKAFGRDASEADQFNSMRLMPSMGEAGAFSGGAYGERMSNPALGQDPARPAALPTDFSAAMPLDDGLNRQIGDQPGDGQVSIRAWDSAAPPVSPARSFSNPDQINNSRFVAPVRSVTLAWPQRPGDPH